MSDAARATLGIDVGGTKVLGVALDADGHVLAEVLEATPPRPFPPGGATGPGDLVETIARTAEALSDCVQATGGPVDAVGVGVPGLVDEHGVLRFAPNLGRARSIDVAGQLDARLSGLRAVVDNDATCAAVGEHAYGSAAGAGDAVVVTLGTGIGGGVVVDGRVARGAHGFAGEIGHVVVDPGGPVCACGKRGCWERYASGSGLASLARQAAHAGRLGEVVNLAGGDPEAVRGEHVTQAALAGDTDARSVLVELGWWVALGLSNLANIFDPSVVVVGGGLLEAVRLVLDTVQATFDELIEGGPQRPRARLALASLGERAGAVGAAVRARHPDGHR